MFDALARLADGKARRVGIFAIAFFLLAGALGGSVASRLDPYGADDPATETVEVREQLQDAGLRVPAVLAVVEDAPVADARQPGPGRRARGRASAAAPTSPPSRGYYDTHSPAFVSRDRDSSYFVDLAEGDRGQGAAGRRRRDRRPAADATPASSSAASRSPRSRSTSRSRSDLRKAEMIAFPLLFLLSLLFFRSLVASVLPLMIGGLAIVGTFLILRLASEFGSISIFALNLTTALGLGLAIDYSLFIVSRYREEIARSGPGLAAMRRVLATAGRTVFFSSLTVSAALASLLVFPQRFLYSMGLGGALVALLRGADLADRAAGGPDPARERGSTPALRSSSSAAPSSDSEADENGFWYRLSRFVMRRPLPVATLSALLLIVMGLPFFGIKFNTVDPTVLPESASARQAYDTVSTEFPPYRETPIWIGVDGGGPGAAARVAAKVRRVDGVAEVLPPQPLRDGVTAIQAVSADPFVSDASQATVKEIRDAPGSGRGDGAGRRRHRGLHRLPVEPRQPPADRAGDRDRRHPGHPLPDDRLGDPADQVADHELPQPQRRLRAAGADLPGRAASRASSTTPARGRSSRRCRSCSSRSPSASPPTTRSSCSRGSRRRATTAPPTPSAWRSAWSGPAASSPPRRCSSPWRWAPSPPPRSSSSRRTGSARRWRC